MSQTFQINTAQAETMHVDMNSCFATVEQQANPFLRGKPIVVMANAGRPFGVALAASIEAKKLGIKTGTRFKEAKSICPNIIALPPDPEKYRAVHRGLANILADYTDEFYPKSIDEFVLNLDKSHRVKKEPLDIAKEIKTRIKNEVGDWITVSVGIGTNRFFAKTAAGFIKPDGLVVMDHTNARELYAHLKLTDLHGINVRNEIRLNRVGIYSPLEMLDAKFETLKSAFLSVNAYYWYTRLRGWETDNVEFSRRSFGNTYTMPEAITDIKRLAPILMKLTTKATRRLRAKGYKTRGVWVGARYQGGGYWHKRETIKQELFDTRDIYKVALKMLKTSPRKPIRNLAVSCFEISNSNALQLNLFDNQIKKRELSKAIDEVNKKWGEYTLSSARMTQNKKDVPDSIAFGNMG